MPLVPQPVNKTKKGCGLGVIGWAMTLFGIFLLAVPVVRDTRLALTGKCTEGLIEKIEERVGKDHRPLHKRRDSESPISYTYHIRYTPEGAASVVFKTTATFGHDRHTGETVPVIYRDDNPLGAEIYSARQLWLPMFTGITLSTVCLVGGIFLIRFSKMRGL